MTAPLSPAPNIFTCSPDLGEEDRFTASWTYLLDCEPQLAQQVLDTIVTAAGITPSPVRHVQDHPPCTVADRPDFLISCEDYDVLCEHKIDSDLGPRQLERYLALDRDRPTYLALVSSRPCAPAHDVLTHPRYLRPSDALPHFRWDAFYRLVQATDSRLARDFTAYMRKLGMRYWAPVGWADLFTNPTTAEAFAAAMVDVRAYFTQRGARVKRDPGNLGMQVQNARPWAPLLWVGAYDRIEWSEPAILGPYFRAALYVLNDSPEMTAFRAEPRRQVIETPDGLLVAQPAWESATWRPDMTCIYRYVMNLERLLAVDPWETRVRLHSAAAAIDELISTMATQGPGAAAPAPSV